MDSQIYKRLERIENKLDENTRTTQDGFERVNGRVKKLERENAYRQGLDVGLKSSSANTWGFWKKVSLIVGIFVGILTIASMMAVAVSRIIL